MIISFSESTCPIPNIVSNNVSTHFGIYVYSGLLHQYIIMVIKATINIVVIRDVLYFNLTKIRMRGSEVFEMEMFVVHTNIM